jgi:hypothetical protein
MAVKLGKARLASGKKIRPYNNAPSYVLAHNNAPNWAYMREANTMRLLVTMRLTRLIIDQCAYMTRNNRKVRAFGRENKPCFLSKG